MTEPIDTAAIRAECEPYGLYDDEPDIIRKLCDEIDNLRSEAAHFRDAYNCLVAHFREVHEQGRLTKPERWEPRADLQCRADKLEAELADLREYAAAVADACSDAGWDPMDNMPIYMWLDTVLPKPDPVECKYVMGTCVDHMECRRDSTDGDRG